MKFKDSFFNFLNFHKFELQTPGNGKTSIVSYIAAVNGFSLMHVRGSDFLSKWVSEGEKMLRCIFSVARKNQPCVMFLDEIDMTVQVSKNGREPANQGILSELLIELDGTINSFSTTLFP